MEHRIAPSLFHPMNGCLPQRWASCNNLGSPEIGWRSRELDHNRAVRAVAFSRDGQLLAIGENVGEGPASVQVWDVQRRQVVARLTANPKSVKSIEFSFDNRYMAASGWNGHLKVWDVSNWELLRTIPNIGHYDIAFSPDGRMLAGTNGNGYVSLWWVEDGTRVARLPGPTEYRHHG